MVEQYYWESDKAHGSYDYNNKNSWKGKQLDMLFEFINNNFTFKDSKEGLKCLDVGCNAGLNMVVFDEKYYNNDNEYVGLDINQTALDYAKQNLKDKNVSLIKSNLAINDVLSEYDDDYFDMVFSTWALTHIPETKQKIKLINDIVRVSKNGLIFEAFQDENSHRKEPLVRQKYDIDKTNVVVYRDYRTFDQNIKLRNLTGFDKESQSGLFWWNKK